MITLDGTMSDLPSFERRSLPRTPAALGALVGDLVRCGTAVWVRGAGSSMSPTIGHDDRVLLVAPTRLAPGSIVLVETPARVVLHRVVRLADERVWTRGDASLIADDPIPLSAVRARAVARERRGRLTALAWTPGLGPSAYARGLWWSLRRRLTGAARRARAMREAAA
jgi:hypothetical protein